MRNISTKADGVGDTLPASDFNANLRSELQNAVTSADFTLDPEGGPDTDVEMFGKAITLYANAAQYYQDSGAANSYVLGRVGNLKELTAYKDGVLVYFKAGNTNTGASTINVDSLGSKDLVDSDGVALVGGEVIQDKYVAARYNDSTGDFEIVFSQSYRDNPLPVSGDKLQNLQVNSDATGFELCGPLTSFKNKIINGNFDFWEYSTSQTSSGYGSDNRWINEHSTSTKTHTRQAHTIGQTDVPGNPKYYSQTVFTTGGGAGDYIRKTQRVESVYTFAGETITLSFYAKAASSLDIATEFLQNFGTTGSPSADVTAIGVTTHSLTTSWQRFTATVAIPSISGKTLGTDNNDYLELLFWLEAGSTYNGRTNSLGNQSGTVQIDRIQIERGPAATDFDDRGIAIDGMLCERYYKTLFNANAVVSVGVGYGITATTARGTVSGLYPSIAMRASSPTVAYTGSTWEILRVGTGYATTGLTFSGKNYGKTISWEATVAAGLAADAGLILRVNSGATSTLTIDAEL